jgi:hypothetical protein
MRMLGIGAALAAVVGVALIEFVCRKRCAWGVYQYTSLRAELTANRTLCIVCHGAPHPAPEARQASMEHQ